MNIKALALAVMITFLGLSGGIQEQAEIIKYEAAERQIEKRDIELCARLLWGEARGVKSKAEQAAVIWCVLNRLDAGYADSIEGVITAKGQFTGYRKSNPITGELYELAEDVLMRYYLEKEGFTDTGRTLPKDYLWFTGYKGRNRFRNKYRGGQYWDWSLPSPYM